MDKYCITANCAFGVENILKRELASLGFFDLKAKNGSFDFFGDAYDVACCNMFLRTAERIFIKVAQFEADTFDALFSGVFAIDWQDFLTEDAKIVVNAKSVKSKLFGLSAIQSISKKAILTKLSAKTGKKVFSEDGATYGVEINFFCDQAVVLLDTSGVGLHKRGYRDFVSTAPIKETLACALLFLSDFSHQKPFCDPFCGSGTIVTEAARIALNIASGRDRDFAFCHWKNFDASAFQRAKQRALDTQHLDRKIDFWGGDISQEAIKLCRRHTERAGLTDKVRFETADIKDFFRSESGGTIVTNPPYGERLGDTKTARCLLSTLGAKYKKLNDWSAFVLTPDQNAERVFGKQCDKKRKLFNADMQCNFYQYFGQSNQGRRFCKMENFL